MKNKPTLITLTYEPISSNKTHFIAEGYSLRDVFKSDGFKSFLSILDSFECCRVCLSYKDSNGLDICLTVQEYIYGMPVNISFYNIVSKM